ncbi:MAG: hypothetical protein KGJ43_05345 [Acidobacteriota bacterium]|nr:hypothetical protein [Acidobacteriota bacterium]
MRRTSAALLAALALPLVAGCGSSAKTNGSTTTATTSAASAAPTTSATSAAAQKPASGPAVKISTATVTGLGTILVDAQGRTLYTFAPDHAAKVTCVSSCALVWPPAKLTAGAHPSGSGGVQASLLGSAPDPEGGSVITYHGWPLYTYVTDTSPGMASGQALNISGGYWYVIAPSGEVIQRKP